MRENLRERLKGCLKGTAACAAGIALVTGAATAMQGYPNPFSTETEIRIELPHAGRIRLTLFDGIGRELRTLLDEERGAGTVTVRLGADELRNGRYTATLTLGKRRQSLAVTVVR